MPEQSSPSCMPRAICLEHARLINQSGQPELYAQSCKQKQNERNERENKGKASEPVHARLINQSSQSELYA